MRASDRRRGDPSEIIRGRITADVSTTDPFTSRVDAGEVARPACEGDRPAGYCIRTVNVIAHTFSAAMSSCAFPTFWFPAWTIELTKLTTSPSTGSLPAVPMIVAE